MPYAMSDNRGIKGKKYFTHFNTCSLLIHHVHIRLDTYHETVKQLTINMNRKWLLGQGHLIYRY